MQGMHLFCVQFIKIISSVKKSIVISDISKHVAETLQSSKAMEWVCKTHQLANLYVFGYEIFLLF